MDEPLNAIEYDDKGRPVINSMTDRELVVELVTSFRQLTDALESFGNNSPMAKFIPGLSKLTGK